MAARTYIPQLRIVLQVVKLYTTRWQTKLQANLTPSQYNCMIAVITAVNDCLIALGEAEVNP